MNKFKPGDLVIATKDNSYHLTGIRAKYPFTVIGYEYGELIVKLDPRDKELLEAEFEEYDGLAEHYFELAQPTINERKMKALLGVSDA